MRARARALAGQLRPKLPRAPAGKTFFFFFPFERARARAGSRAGLFPAGRAPVRTRAHSPCLGQSGGRGVGELTVLLAESSRSIPKVAPLALLF